MTDKPKTGRVLRVLSQVARAEREQAIRHREWIEQKLFEGCPDPEDPAVLAAWQAEQDVLARDEGNAFRRIIEEGDDELQLIRDNRPLGVPPPIEPRSIHSPISQPPWKRKLRP